MNEQHHSEDHYMDGDHGLDNRGLYHILDHQHYPSDDLGQLNLRVGTAIETHRNIADVDPHMRAEFVDQTHSPFTHRDLTHNPQGLWQGDQEHPSPQHSGDGFDFSWGGNHGFVDQDLDGRAQLFGTVDGDARRDILFGDGAIADEFHSAGLPVANSDLLTGVTLDTPDGAYEETSRALGPVQSPYHLPPLGSSPYSSHPPISSTTLPKITVPASYGGDSAHLYEHRLPQAGQGHVSGGRFGASHTTDHAQWDSHNASPDAGSGFGDIESVSDGRLSKAHAGGRPEMVALGLDQSQHLEPGKAGSKRWAREDSDRNRGGGGGGGQKKAEPPSRTEDLNRRKTLERVPQPARRERPDESETESDFELQPASDVESPGVVRHEHVEVIVAGRADVTIRRLHDRRFVKLWADEDVRCFDAVVKWKAFNKEASKEKALTVFCPKFRAADAIVSVIYGVEQWDYILRFKKSKHEDAAVLARNEFERRLCKRGVVMEHEQSKEKSSTIYVKLLVPFHVLCVEARTLKLMFRLKNRSLLVWSLHLDLNVQHAVLDSKNLSNYQFKLLQKDNTYKFVDCESQPAHVVRTKFFEERHRILIAYNLLDQIEIKLKTNQRFRCEGIHYLIDHRFYTDMYPVHQSDDLDDDVEKMDAKTRLAQAQNHEWTLRTRLINGFVKSRQQPIDLMRDYFGEKIALYFVYLQFYNHWLAGSSVFGVIVFIFGIVVTVVNDDNSATDWHHLFDNALSPYFALLMALWSVLYLRYWQRRNSYFSIKWATHTFEASTIQRHAFEPAGKRLSPITGKIELHYPSYKRHIRQFISFLATLPFVGLVIATVLAQIAFIAWLQNTYHTSEQGTALAASLIGLVSIQICRRCYRPVALRLNEFENYKSEDGFERALVVKNWCFEFLNIYSHIIYFAFVRPFLTGATILGFPRHEADCEKDICSADVTLELIIIFLGDQAVDRMEEILLPWIVNKFRSMRMAFRKVVPDEKHWPQYYKDERRQANEGLDDDYFQKAIQYGYVTMFVTAFPLAPLCAYINNVFEVRLDAYKMLKVLRRPPSFPADSIGIWESILQFCSLLAVSTNGLLVAFTSSYFFSTFIEPSPAENWLAIRLGFLLFWHVAVYFISFVVMWLVPPRPYIVQVANARELYLERVAIDPNHIAEDEVEDAEEVNSYVDLTKHKVVGEDEQRGTFDSLQNI